jgi:hypothetical protein
LEFPELGTLRLQSGRAHISYESGLLLSKGIVGDVMEVLSGDGKVDEGSVDVG